MQSRPLFAVLVLFAPALPLMLSGALRAAIGIPLWWALALSVVATAGGLFLLRGHLRLPTRVQWIPLTLAAVAAATLCWLLVNPELGPLVSVGGGDAGNHVSLMRAFVAEDPGVYEKFVVFHAVAHWLGPGIGFGDAAGFALAFYLVVACVFLCAGAAAAALTPEDSRAAWIVLAAVLAAGVLRVWGPWLHYQQADGFYAHLFGLVPLLLGWLAYGAAESVWVRVAVVLAWVGLSRFTYGLNLGDYLAAGALLFVWEGRRWPFVAGAVALFGASVVAFAALAPLRLVPHGSIVAADVRQLLLAQGLMVAFLAVSLWSQGALRGATTRLPQRLTLFPLSVGAVSLAVQVLYLAAKWPQRYYFLKYNFLSVVLLSAACAALLPWWLTRRSPRAAVAVAAVAAFVLIAFATSPQWFTFRERAFGGPLYEHVDALTDPPLVEHAQSVLREAGARSGGYLEPNWARSNFINATLGSFDAFKDGVDRFASASVEQEGDTCVFWLEREGVGAQNALTGATDKKCQPHQRRWEPGEKLRLCWRCGPPRL